MQYFFCEWLVSLGIMLSMFILVVTYSRIPFFLKAGSHFIVHTSPSIHPQACSPHPSSVSASLPHFTGCLLFFKHTPGMLTAPHVCILGSIFLEHSYPVCLHGPAALLLGVWAQRAPQQSLPWLSYLKLHPLPSYTPYSPTSLFFLLANYIFWPFIYLLFAFLNEKVRPVEMGVFLLTAAIPLAREAGSVSAEPLSERSTPGSFFLCKKMKIFHTYLYYYTRFYL